jgi:hypothetical protein
MKKMFVAVPLVAILFIGAVAAISSARAQKSHPAGPPYTVYVIQEIEAPNLTSNSIEEIHLMGEVKGFSCTNGNCYALVLPSFTSKPTQ